MLTNNKIRNMLFLLVIGSSVLYCSPFPGQVNTGQRLDLFRSRVHRASSLIAFSIYNVTRVELRHDTCIMYLPANIHSAIENHPLFAPVMRNKTATWLFPKSIKQLKDGPMLRIQELTLEIDSAQNSAGAEWYTTAITPFITDANSFMLPTKGVYFLYKSSVTNFRRLSIYGRTFHICFARDPVDNPAEETFFAFYQPSPPKEKNKQGNETGHSPQQQKQGGLDQAVAESDEHDEVDHSVNEGPEPAEMYNPALNTDRLSENSGQSGVFSAQEFTAQNSDGIQSAPWPDRSFQADQDDSPARSSSTPFKQSSGSLSSSWELGIQNASKISVPEGNNTTHPSSPFGNR